MAYGREMYWPINFASELALAIQHESHTCKFGFHVK